MTDDSKTPYWLYYPEYKFCKLLFSLSSFRSPFSDDKRFWFREKRIYIENGKSGIVHLPNVACHYEAAAVEEDIVAPEKHVVSIKVTLNTICGT